MANISRNFSQKHPNPVVARRSNANDGERKVKQKQLAMERRLQERLHERQTAQTLINALPDNHATLAGIDSGDGASTMFKTFDMLPLSKLTLDALSEAKYTHMTQIQRVAIPIALKGRDILGAARTGSGKTLAFLIPALELLWRLDWDKMQGVGVLVITPTRELAVQIFDVLRAIGKNHDFSAGLIIGGKALDEEKKHILTMNILVCTPGRLLQHLEQTYNFSLDSLQMLVLDEADRILDMGFQSTLDDILSHLPTQRQTLLFSATQTSSVKNLARLSLNNPDYVSVHDISTPNKLEQTYTIAPAERKLDILYSFIRTHLRNKSIVFFSTTKQVRFVFEMFRRMRPGIPLMHIHGKMSQERRLSIYYDYANKAAAVLFCTDIASRGLDFPDMDWVVQFDTPESVETYIHRVGRTARYRSKGKSLLLILPSELEFLKLLAAKKLQLKKVKVLAEKLQHTQTMIEGFLAQDPELKFLGQRAFITYVRSVLLQSDKSIFDVSKLPLEELAHSMGLPGAPKIKSVSAVSHNSLKNMSYTVANLVDMRKRRQLQQRSQVEKLLSRKNTTVFDESRQKILQRDDDSDADDEVLTVKHGIQQHESEDIHKAIDDISSFDSSGDTDDTSGDDNNDSISMIDNTGRNRRKRKPRLPVELDIAIRQTKAQKRGTALSSYADINKDNSAVRAALFEVDKHTSELKQRLKVDDVIDKAHDRERVHEKHTKRRMKAREQRQQANKTGAVLSVGQVATVTDEDGYLSAIDESQEDESLAAEIPINNIAEQERIAIELLSRKT